MKKTKIKKDLFNRIKEIGSGSKIRGITLISLVITIIILLILAGISIAQLTGNGLFEKAKLAKEESKNAQNLEEIEIGKFSNQIEEYAVDNSSRDAQAQIINLQNQIKALTPELIWTNPSPESSFAPQTVSLDLKNYKFIIITTYTKGCTYTKSSGIFPVESSNEFRVASTGGSASRGMTINNEGITFGNGGWGGYATDNTSVIPYKIYGLKGDINIDL